MPQQTSAGALSDVIDLDTAYGSCENRKRTHGFRVITSATYALIVGRIQHIFARRVFNVRTYSPFFEAAQKRRSQLFFCDTASKVGANSPIEIGTGRKRRSGSNQTSEVEEFLGSRSRSWRPDRSSSEQSRILSYCMGTLTRGNCSTLAAATALNGTNFLAKGGGGPEISPEQGQIFTEGKS